MIPVYESYAEALFEASEKLGCADVVAGELGAMDELLKQCGSYLGNPLISAGTKAAVLRESLSDKLSSLTLEFIVLMASRRHLKHFHATAELYLHLSGYSKPVVRLRVPFIPEQEMLMRLKKRLSAEKLIPENTEDAQVQVIEDKELIGGFIASCNGYQIDTSLKTTLMKLLHPERLVYNSDRC